MIRISRVVALSLAASLLATVVFAAPLDKVQVVKISPRDQRAVIKGADGKLRVIKPGDVIGASATVKEIGPGRVVLEEKTDRGPETVIVRLAGGVTRTERLRKTPESRPLLVAPAKGGK